MEISQVVYHFANILSLIAWVVTDILWVRAIAIVANVFSLAYYLQHSDIYRLNISWHATYIVINSVQIAIILYRRRPIKFDDKELALYKQVFVGLSPYEFKSLLNHARWNTYEKQEAVAQQGKELQEVMVLVLGDAEVRVNGHAVGSINEGSFIGELSFLHGGPASADVVTRGYCTIASWQKDDLARFLRNNPTIATAWQVGMGHDLANKLTRSTQNR